MSFVLAAISDLHIRPFKITQPGEVTHASNEFELQEVIGEGGVGIVYAARQASIDRTQSETAAKKAQIDKLA